MCYIGKATKIFIFLITVLLITSLIFGFTFLRPRIHPNKSHKCSADYSCSQSDLYPPPIPSTPDPSDLTTTPPPPPLPSPPPSGLNSDLSPPPPAESLAPPPSDSSINQTPPVAPPPGFNPVPPGPVDSSQFEPNV